MGEIKSVKVDNWGVFFLQKLQNFFNKTDYCDLTLQFKDNSQLKVHRLVLSACTDFFNVLEQTCELMDDALVMPNELQADVVVPIVNFMYTGTLEFELKMYSKLLRTAREMNMTVLLKLLEAHKRTMDSSKLTGPKPGSPKNKPKRIVDSFPPFSKLIASPSTVSSSQQMQRRIVSAVPTPSTPVRRITNARQAPGTTMFRQIGSSLLKAPPKMQRGPTRFETMDMNAQTQSYETSFDSMSYESRPLKEEPEDYDRIYVSPQKSRSSPFEQLRKGYNNNKRPAVSTFTSPPAKKPNIEDVKEFSEQQRMRKQIAAEYGDDAEYDGVLDDEFHNDDDDDEPSAGGQASTSSGRQQQQYEQASIIIKQSPNEKPTIVVKDSSNSKMDHAKIISEVLRQYPHLVKTNKNIKLKIMPNMGGQSQKIIIKKEAIENASAEMEQNRVTGIQARQQLMEINKKSPTILRTQAKQTMTAAPIKTEVQTSPQPRASTAVAATTTSGNAASTEAGKAPQQKRRIDSKTMHALIAMGAENTTGPWLCLQCGVNGRPISIPSYRGFRRHLVNTHKESIDAALCEHCGWRSSSNRVLHHHMLVEHKIPSSSHVFPQCEHCNQICLDSKELATHIERDHPDAHKQQCIYCNKIFSKELQLYLHMKSFHKKRAREDGVIDFTDDELDDFEEEMRPESTTSVDKKIKIISDISLPSTILKLEEAPSASEDDYANDSGPKFVNADGNEMVLTAEQREEIMAQLEQDPDGGVVMVLNESTFPPGEAEIETEAEGTTLESKDEGNQHEDEFDDHNIYTEFPHIGEPANEASADEGAVEANKEEEERTLEHEQDSDHDERMDDDHMEWAEHVISAHDVDDDDEEVQEDDEEKDDTDGEKKKAVGKADATNEKNARDSKSSTKSAKDGEKDKKKEEDISQKLKMLTGDWSDDEIDEEDDGPIADQSDKEKPQEETLITEEAKEKTKEEIDEEHPPEAEEAEESANKEEDVEKTVSEAAEAEDAEEKEESPEVALPEKLEDAAKKIVKEASPDISKDDSVEAETSEAKTADSAIETKEETKTASTSKKPSSRRTSIKDDSAVENLKDIKVEEDIHEEAEVPSPKESKEEPLASAADECIKDELPEGEVKSDKIIDKDEAVGTSKKSSDDDSLKTGDKVKSLISEWVDDDDEDL